MTHGPVQRDTTGDRTHPGRVGAGLCRTAASESAVPRAPRTCDEAEPVLSPVVGAVPGASVHVARAAERGQDAPRARHEFEPVLSPARRRGRVEAVGAGPDGPVHVARTAGRDQGAPHGRAVGDNRRATLRCGAASLTETAGRAPFEQHAKAAGEDAR
ncbi:DUF6380 family protein [Streptomyces variegatus]|uniref:DUF6380 family protein n=1 Tax=Streptomyces variegatus TaxID=284040 RepID=UPI003C2FD06B